MPRNTAITRNTDPPAGGTHKDIEPFMDEKPENNIILTKTEGLTMSSRPNNPANDRNKNVLIVGANVIIGLSPSDFRKEGSHNGLVHFCLISQ